MKDKHASKQASQQATNGYQSINARGGTKAAMVPRKHSWKHSADGPHLVGALIRSGACRSSIPSRSHRHYVPKVPTHSKRKKETKKERNKERKKERNKQTKEKLESDVDSQNKHSRTGQNSAEHSATAKATNLQKAHHRTWRSDQSIHQSINQSIDQKSCNPSSRHQPSSRDRPFSLLWPV